MQGPPGIKEAARQAGTRHRTIAQACPTLAAGLLPLLQALQGRVAAPAAASAASQHPAGDAASVRTAAELLAAVTPHMPTAQAQVGLHLCTYKIWDTVVSNVYHIWCSLI